MRGQGRLPADGTGRALSLEEVLAWSGSGKLLTQREHEEVKKEICEGTEAEALSEKLGLGLQA